MHTFSSSKEHLTSDSSALVLQFLTSLDNSSSTNEVSLASSSNASSSPSMVLTSMISRNLVSSSALIVPSQSDNRSLASSACCSSSEICFCWASLCSMESLSYEKRNVSYKDSFNQSSL